MHVHIQVSRERRRLVQRELPNVQPSCMAPQRMTQEKYIESKPLASNINRHTAQKNFVLNNPPVKKSNKAESCSDCSLDNKLKTFQTS